ncbi:A/G-specific DNA-adenine glycosylase [Jannaschia faecimaris]|uniref:Adenine DNA glycosylase n=1 Tax=Jannaschia faecimaris TaxID=1244108 RepID=A0A1H3IXY4_9RHOB|nr:A/G-specific adenine glycosylase [Jannaschia faecimaris]SDY32586.1 A/G-specific DNA-adenine glycosylase [Jannaschia faecimaris]
MRDDRSEALRDWYGRQARALPWRIPPGSDAMPDPYRIWLSEVMLQQTTVAAVKAYFATFTTTWPTVHDLAAADDAAVMAAWAGLGYYARARNLLKCARAVVADHDGVFPRTEADLLTLHGIGPYTAAAIAAIAFQSRAVVVDGNVERVMTRLGAIETPLPGAKPEIRALADTLTPDTRPGDHAQAVMDLGATICTPKSPACVLCPLRDHCDGRKAGIAESLPRKAPKIPKPERRGYVYVARRGAQCLLETRPAKGLLGGMLAFPTSDWSDTPIPAAPFDARWKDAGEVRHTFTHFHLTLRVLTTTQGGNPDRGEWAPLDPKALPTVFAKAWRQAFPDT